MGGEISVVSVILFCANVAHLQCSTIYYVFGCAFGKNKKKVNYLFYELKTSVSMSIFVGSNGNSKDSEFFLFRDVFRHRDQRTNVFLCATPVMISGKRIQSHVVYKNVGVGIYSVLNRNISSMV